MGLNGNNVAGGGAKRAPQENMKPGAKPARPVQLIDLGVQPQRPYMGQEKKPAHMIYLTYELSHEFLKDGDGNLLEDKPRWISEDFPFYSLSNDRARSTKRYNALDPNGECGGDFDKLLARPCNVVIVNNPGKGKNAGKVFDNIADVTPAADMPGYVQPELVNKPKVFLLDEPDMEVFGSLPEWLQDRVKGNLNYQGSKLQGLLEGEATTPPPQEEVPQEDAGDSPY